LTVQPRTTRLVYLQPQCTHVVCGVEISIPVPVAHRVVTRKGFTGVCTEMQTAMTHLGGIRRRDHEQQYTRQMGFIRHKLPELIEGPTIATAPFRLGSGLRVRAFSNAGQVFQRQSGLLRLRGLDKRLCNDMVGVALEPPLPPRQPCQKRTATPSRTSGALRGFVLESGPQTGKVITAVW